MHDGESGISACQTVLCTVETGNLLLRRGAQAEDCSDRQECDRDRDCRKCCGTEHSQELYAEKLETAAVEETEHFISPGTLFVEKRPTAIVPHIPFIQWTATAPTGSSTRRTLSRNHTPNTTRSPATSPITIEPKQSTESQGAVIATRPAREAFRHMETKIMQTTVATEGATVVVRKILPSCGTLVAAAPLKPYQPSHKMKTPSAPSGML